ncbi:MAG: hypothetical protein M1827_006132 [Pycnora praestabilis]|nr:MAG: hypothetical protein M1827_006132 [Pycnora praestabilis]
MSIPTSSVAGHIPNYTNPPSHVSTILAVDIFWACLSTLVVFERLYARIRIARFKGADDWLMFAAWIASLMNLSVWILYANYGNGRHIWDIKPSELTPLAKTLWFVQIFYPISLTFVKLSILTFYLRLFPYEGFRRLVYFSMAFVVGICISSCFAFIFQCTPIHYSWAPPVLAEQHCIHNDVLQYAIAGLGLLSDIFILFMPIKYLWALSISWKKKLEVLCLFSLGSLACIASLIRLTTIHTVATSPDPTWEGFAISIWSSTELNLGIITASLPATKPFLKKALWWRISNSTPNSGKSDPRTSASTEVATKTDVGDHQLGHCHTLNTHHILDPPRQSNSEDQFDESAITLADDRKGEV